MYRARYSPEIAAAYRHCGKVASAHYENFTVASFLLPRRLRQHIAAIYAFARAADDFADEGNMSAAQRVQQLQEWEEHLDACYRGDARHPVFIALAHTIAVFDIPAAPFHQLLAAFRYDVRFQPFATFDALRSYCGQSADPVGHLLLYLFGYRDAQRQRLADDICSGLQLANFWQDLKIDGSRGRVYVPLDDLQRFDCSVDEIMEGRATYRIRRLLAFEVARTRMLLHQGESLAALVDTRLAREVRLFVWGGEAILNAIEASGYDVFTHRPTVSKPTKALLVLRTLLLSVNGSPRRWGAPAQIGPRSGEPRTRTIETTTPPDITIELGGTEPVAYGNGSEFRVQSRTLHDAYAYCQDLTRRSSSNFYYAFRLLSPERRKALHAVYAFCRFADDIADEVGRTQPAQLLARWREELDRVYAGNATHPIGEALTDAVQRFPLARHHFLDLVRGVEMDLVHHRYATFDELYEYCYSVASTVGLLCIEIFGYQHASARDYAVDLGIAFQLTNILRDVLEDAQRGRIYLPLEDLRRFDCTEADLLGGRYTPRVGALMAFECGRARAYYLRARGALSPGDLSSMAAAEAMRLIYERLLDRIEARHFNVFGPKVTLPRYEKFTLAMAAWGRAQLATLQF